MFHNLFVERTSDQDNYLQEVIEMVFQHDAEEAQWVGINVEDIHHNDMSFWINEYLPDSILSKGFNKATDRLRVVRREVAYVNFFGLFFTRNELINNVLKGTDVFVLYPHAFVQSDKYHVTQRECSETFLRLFKEDIFKDTDVMVITRYINYKSNKVDVTISFVKEDVSFITCSTLEEYHTHVK